MPLNSSLEKSRLNDLASKVCHAHRLAHAVWEGLLDEMFFKRNGIDGAIGQGQQPGSFLNLE